MGSDPLCFVSRFEYTASTTFWVCLPLTLRRMALHAVLKED